jgi:putative membrane protein
MRKIIDFVKGIFIGIALVIPGLSGSIFAVVVGLYESILNAVNNIRKEFKKSFLFLLPIVLGVGVGILASTKLVLWVTENYKQQSYFFFIGLVLGSLPLILRKVKGIKFKPQYLLITVAAFVGLMLISFLLTGNVDESAAKLPKIEKITGVDDVLILTFAGIFSCATMSIPGVSGSVMLMVVGHYGSVYNAVGNCADFLKALLTGNIDEAKVAASSILVVLPFMIGAVIGIALIAKILVYLLKKYEAQMYYGVGGLVAGAVVTLLTEAIKDPTFTFSIGVGKFLLILLIDAVLVVIGIICTKYLDK